MTTAQVPDPDDELEEFEIERVVRISRDALVRRVMRNQYIKSCQNVYTISDVAAYFHLSIQGIYAIWRITPENDLEPPNIPNTTKITNFRDYEEDVMILLNRGISVKEVAEQTGLHVQTIISNLKCTIRGREALLNSGREERKIEHARTVRVNQL